MTEIQPATTLADYQTIAQFYQLFKEWVVTTYPEIQQELQSFLTNLDREIQLLHGGAPLPDTQLFLARIDGVPAGTAALTSRSPSHCELRHMFVDPQFRGRQLGRLLAQ